MQVAGCRLQPLVGGDGRTHLSAHAPPQPLTRHVKDGAQLPPRLHGAPRRFHLKAEASELRGALRRAVPQVDEVGQEATPARLILEERSERAVVEGVEEDQREPQPSEGLPLLNEALSKAWLNV